MVNKVQYIVIAVKGSLAAAEQLFIKARDIDSTDPSVHQHYGLSVHGVHGVTSDQACLLVKAANFLWLKNFQCNKFYCQMGSVTAKVFTVPFVVKYVIQLT